MALNMVQLGPLSINPPKSVAPLRIKHQDKAAYGVGGKGFFDNKRFWYPGEALYFDGEPNLNFTPLNKLAYERMQAFLDKLDAAGMKRAKKDNKDYTPMAREPWDDEAEHNEIPMPEFLMGVPIKEDNEAIR